MFAAVTREEIEGAEEEEQVEVAGEEERKKGKGTNNSKIRTTRGRKDVVVVAVAARVSESR